MRRALQPLSADGVHFWQLAEQHFRVGAALAMRAGHRVQFDALDVLRGSGNLAFK